jgi:hypothetical protein
MDSTGVLKSDFVGRGGDLLRMTGLRCEVTFAERGYPGERGGQASEGFDKTPSRRIYIHVVV